MYYALKEPKSGKLDVFWFGVYDKKEEAEETAKKFNLETIELTDKDAREMILTRLYNDAEWRYDEMGLDDDEAIWNMFERDLENYKTEKLPGYELLGSYDDAIDFINEK